MEGGFDSSGEVDVGGIGSGCGREVWQRVGEGGVFGRRGMSGIGSAEMNE